MTGSHSQSTVPVCAITVSDRCWRGETEDLSGPLAVWLLADYGIDANLFPISDEFEAIQEAIISTSREKARPIFMTSGTSLASHGIIPEVTEALLNTRIRDPEDVMRRAGEGHVPTATLNRGFVGVTSHAPGEVLAVNVPGPSGGMKDVVGVIDPPVAHILDQLTGGDHPR